MQGIIGISTFFPTDFCPEKNGGEGENKKIRGEGNKNSSN
jgi:hypothetical protein